MIYHCKACEYSTTYLSHYSSHLVTKKHTRKVHIPANGSVNNKRDSSQPVINNEEIIMPPILIQSNKEPKIYKCKFCDVIYNKSGNLNRHYKVCALRNDSKTQILEMENQKIKEELETLKQDKQYNQNLNVANTHNINGLIQINMKTLTFLNTYFNNAPALQDFSHYFKDMYAFFIDYKKFPQIENTNNILFDGKEVNKDDYISDKIIFLQQENNIVKYFSDKIIEHFRNKDFPELQSYWSSDTFRNNYNIRTEYKNVSTWHTDKQGLIISEKILEPLLDFVTDITSAKLMSLAEKNKKEKELHKKMPIVKKQQTLTEFNLSVAHKEIQPEIMKKIAPSFFLDMDKEKLKINMRKLE
jgi:hypothetical protein